MFIYSLLHNGDDYDMNYMDYLNNSMFSTDCVWEDGSYLRVDQQGKTSVRIRANKAGLISLANQLILLADCTEHSIIYQPWPGDLEMGSLDLEIQRVICDGRIGSNE